jgi:hypothetical protein
MPFLKFFRKETVCTPKHSHQQNSMQKHRNLFLFLVLFSLPFLSEAQRRDRDLVQFSGIIVSVDSLQPVPFCDIMIKNAHRGTTSDFNGYFSFVAKKKDIIEFSAVGFKKMIFTIPDTITRDRYSLIQAMTSDTIMLTEAVIYPWPSIEQFKDAFVKMHIPDDDIEIARKNLNRMQIHERAKTIAMDGTMNYRNSMSNITSKLYYAGQVPPNNLLNPFAWAQFIKAWREGKLKMSDQ